MDRKVAFLSLLIIGAIVLFGCLQEQAAEPRGNPPQAAFVPLVENPQQNATPAIPPEEAGPEECDPPQIDNYCENVTMRYYDFKCEEGEWQYKTQRCAYECRDGECVHTGCPPCDDEDPCTTDLCSGAPSYECIHIPDASCQPSTGKGCAPVASAGNIRIDIYPAGKNTEIGATPQMSQVMVPGERMWLDQDDFISFQAFVLQGSCPQCFYPPIMKWPPSAKLYISKDLSGTDSTYLEDEGEFNYICIEGYCRNANPGVCSDYICNTTMKFVVAKMDVNLTCT